MLDSSRLDIIAEEIEKAAEYAALKQKEVHRSFKDDGSVLTEADTAISRTITEKIRLIDETINNKHLLEKEYERRNELLPLEEKIFSI